MIVNHALVQTNLYSISFHSLAAAQAFSEELKTRNDVYGVTLARTTVTFRMDNAIGKALAKEFQARWLQKLETEAQKRQISSE